MTQENSYWNGLEQYHGEIQDNQEKEFASELPIEESLSEESLGLKSNRRDFLKIFGFGLTAATLAACEKPIKHAVPYVNKPEDVTPGVASWYASTCHGCSAACGILVKTREGRPIKIEGNPEAKTSLGGTCAVGQSTVLSLYDRNRLQGPMMDGNSTTWAALDAAVKAKLSGLSTGGKVRLLTGTITSPATKELIRTMAGQFVDFKHIQFDALSVSAISEAHKRDFGKRAIPSYNFDKANVIVSFEADFLGSWISPVEFTKGYSKNRKLNQDNPSMSRHIQFESQMSLTGSNADLRIPMKPSKQGAALLTLHKLLGGSISGNNANENGPGNAIQKAAQLLQANKGQSLVVCGINDLAAQQVVNDINKMLGNYGNTLDIQQHSNQKQGDDAEMQALHDELETIDALIMIDVNPVYHWYKGADFAAKMAKPFTVHITYKADETSEHSKVIAAGHHAFETWNDASPRAGHYHMTQPAIRPIYDTRQAHDSLLVWTGANKTWLEFLKEYWQKNIFPTQTNVLMFSDFWNQVVHDGVYYSGTTSVPAPVPLVAAKVKDAKAAKVTEPVALEAPATDLSEAAATLMAQAAAEGNEVLLYSKVSLGDGQWGNNPWLQEMPDPMTKVTWDNYVCLPYGDAEAAGIKEGQMLTLTANGKSLTLPVIVMPGQAKGTYAVALGYGRTKSGKVGDGVGQNAFPLVRMDEKNKTLRYDSTGASVSASPGEYWLAKTQTHISTMDQAEGGDKERLKIADRVSDHIVKETTLGEYMNDRTAGNKNRPSDHHFVSLWDVHDKKGYHWGMAIDLNACTGCGSCIVSCNAENNIPVVGRDEVRTRRELHWMRIDRYFRGHPDDQNGGLVVAHQPMLCQHCNNAPCETVCPVLATTHSDEGLNQQIYNRCIGTRYCANNCPYKVRRFNWFRYYENNKFDYNMNDKLEMLVLNPDVTVRARGVMEKCTFCVQRIQEKKLNAKAEMRKVNDGEIKTACQQSCPADAIVFGDLNDKNSEIWKLYNNKRAYHALEEVKTLPAIAYLTKVRNSEKSEETSSTPETH